MSDRYQNEKACGIEPEREGDEPTLAQWRDRCRQLWGQNFVMRAAIAAECHRLEHDYNAADVTYARRALMAAAAS